MNRAVAFFSSRIWDRVWLVSGILAIIISSYFTFEEFNLLFFTSFIGSILGLIIVQAMANLKGKFGSGLGVIGACFDGFNNFSYGIMAQALLAVYAGATYIIGFFTLNKKIKVSSANMNNVLISASVGVLGIIIIYFFGQGLLPLETPDSIFYITVLSFILQVVGQYLMISGKALSWYFWILANILNIVVYSALFFLNLEPQAIFYLIMTVMYLLNSIKATFIWVFGDKE
ncbi:MAG: nicotinamide mononucleotide transporter family protein [Bifidobacteriaceae bacterium]|jgi:nicotinamide mononucleotide transporter PnuC|nr:nicotinamide mononucleotide transporter family protein [Bifidobacteriaceae bacterium]